MLTFYPDRATLCRIPVQTPGLVCAPTLNLLADFRWQRICKRDWQRKLQEQRM
jgi:hypothetical protein